MKVYASDQEQLKAITTWWQQNKKSMLSCVLIFLLTYSAYHAYNYHQVSSSQAAATTYYNILSSVANNDINLAKSQITSLQEEYASSSYATLSSLIFAKLLIDEKAYSEAIKQLSWVLEHGDKSFHDLASIRIARINLAINKPALAITALTTVVNKSQLAEKNIVLGDAYLQLNNTAAAKQAYKTAMQNADKIKVYELWELASMKYNSLNA